MESLVSVDKLKIHKKYQPLLVYMLKNPGGQSAQILKHKCKTPTKVVQNLMWNWVKRGLVERKRYGVYELTGRGRELAARYYVKEAEHPESPTIITKMAETEVPFHTDVKETDRDGLESPSKQAAAYAEPAAYGLPKGQEQPPMYWEYEARFWKDKYIEISMELAGRA